VAAWFSRGPDHRNRWNSGFGFLIRRRRRRSWRAVATTSAIGLVKTATLKNNAGG